ncbi:thioredoxin-disulfide reductase [Xylanivirga thermophila]|jgi:thioredoxin reductase (NADPH)|uniref:thioredoxin-disulfide reductase n=1 Tax=Xylanivirga thermophila TaxID=2496273 RepID=UPI00101C4A1D|nr:thioredoxin-disulfide reductase [Xylanivirga thermophila]
MYDVIIVGGGVAGLTAGIYAKRAGMNALLFEQMFPGGQIATTYMVENYPGFIEPISGPDLAMKLEEHARKFNLDIMYDQVMNLNIDGKIKKVITNKGEYEAKTLILAMGAQPKMLGLDKEQKFRGRGVSYCATCDAMFYKGQDVAVVGGGDTALTDAIYLAQYANRVYLIHRRDEFRASQILQDRVMKNDKIHVIWNSNVESILGEEKVTGIRIRNKINNDMEDIELQGMFVAIGIQPNNELIIDKVKTTDSGFAIVNENMETDIPGVFVAGDLRQKPLWQIITAASDGAIAAMAAQRYIIEKFEEGLSGN